MMRYSTIGVLFVTVLIGGCRSRQAASDAPSPPGQNFWSDDSKLSEMIVGQWIKDESYSYGRFIGEHSFTDNGKCILKFSVYEDNGELQPLSVERGKWRADKGYIVFHDLVAEGLDPSDSDFGVLENQPEQREWVMQLNKEELMTVDERNKIDSFKRVDPKKQ